MNNEIELNETVKVLASFDNRATAPCRPRRVLRPNSQDINITGLGLYFTEHRKGHLIHIFDVTDDNADYRLELDATTLVWHLVREADRAI